MKTVHVNTAKEYDVLIGSGLLAQLPRRIGDISGAEKIAIVSDSNVWPIYGPCVESALLEAGYEVSAFIFAAGEASKNGETYLSLLEMLASSKVTRSDLILALGGGVVGDMAGFAAATYLRGIHYVQVPTTLLAAVDSSVGGKTAIDLPSGKNLAGAFYQPKLVLCDLDTLDTLPEDIFRDGCAEVIKYGILYDRELFDHLQKYGLQFDRQYVIARCVELKRNVVTEDEFDRGNRQKLNLGHTLGHAVEKLSNYRISHGQAVAIGTAMISRSACAKGLCSTDACGNICKILKQFGLPTTTDNTSVALLQAALSDKKRSGGMVNLILPRDIGDCTIFPCPVPDLESYIEAGL